MDTSQIAHDIAVAVAAKTADTPETVVKAYFDLLPQVKAYVSEEKAKARKSGKIVSKSDTGLF